MCVIRSTLSGGFYHTGRSGVKFSSNLNVSSPQKKPSPGGGKQLNIMDELNSRFSLGAKSFLNLTSETDDTLHVPNVQEPKSHYIIK